MGINGNGSRDSVRCAVAEEEERVQGAGRYRGRGRVGADFFFQHDASRISREPRTLWCLQNISGPGAFTGNAKLVAIPRIHTQRRSCEEDRRGRKERGQRTRKRNWERKESREGNIRSSFLRDQGCSVIFFFFL